MTATPVIHAQQLSLEYRLQGGWQNAIRGVTLSIDRQQIHGLVGESGSGKSTLGMGLMGYLPENARFAGGSILFDDKDLTRLSPADAARLRGRLIGFVPQNPLDALNPSLTIGEQLQEVTRYHLRLSRAAAHQRACQALEQTRIAEPEAVLRRYPHQLSGGMQQRVMIAMALSTRPRLLVLDEPTTALDVTTQAVILDLIRDLIREENAAALYVSHNLGTIARLCDTVTVLYAGEVMESAPVQTLFRRPLHPYTIGLLASLPGAAGGQQSRLATIDGTAAPLTGRPAACVFAERCPLVIAQCRTHKPPLEQQPDGRSLRCWRGPEIAAGSVNPARPAHVSPAAAAPADAVPILRAEKLRKTFHDASLFDRLTGKASAPLKALDNVSLTINRQATFGLVGESGSGKTTLARVIAGLTVGDDGRLELLDRPLALPLHRRSPEALRNIRMVFQNPGDTLNPYYTVGQALGRTLSVFGRGQFSREEIARRTAALLEAVGLTAAYAGRYPEQLSGGEKQRVAIARAFAASPALIIADEPTSALDVSVQAVILNLLKDLRADKGVSYLFISHDLEVIGYLADWIGVMYLGEIVEQGTRDQVSAPPMHPYTEALLSASPSVDLTQPAQGIRLTGDIPSPRQKPAGCPFHTRCPRRLGPICAAEVPPLQIGEGGHQIRCHIPLADLRTLQSTPGGSG